MGKQRGVGTLVTVGDPGVDGVRGGLDGRVAVLVEVADGVTDPVDVCLGVQDHVG